MFETLGLQLVQCFNVFHVSSDSGLDSETALSLGHLLAELAAEGTSRFISGIYRVNESFGLRLHLVSFGQASGYRLWVPFGYDGCPG